MEKQKPEKEKQKPEKEKQKPEKMGKQKPEKKLKQTQDGNEYDLIFNINHPLKQLDTLYGQMYEFGNVYLSRASALNPLFIQGKNIKCVLTVMDDKSYSKAKIDKKIQELDDIAQHMYIQTQDHQESFIAPYFQQTYQFIKCAILNKFNVLVHCKGGRSRSPAILTAFLIKEFRISFEEAYQIVKKQREVVNINQGFQKQLKEYQRKLIKEDEK